MRWLQPNLASLLSTDGNCVVCECVVVGKPAVHGNRRRTVEPGEERQLLQVVVKSVDRARDRGNIRTGQRITDLQVALASAHLADVPPTAASDCCQTGRPSIRLLREPRSKCHE